MPDEMSTSAFSLLQGRTLETTRSGGVEVGLLASGDGTEVIHHRLAEGSHWAMVPEAGWTALECVIVLSGDLTVKSTAGERKLRAGDALSAHPVREHLVFVANTNAEFVYVTSQPVFHLYSSLAREMMDHAVHIEEVDGYTADHCRRIKELSMNVGKLMGLDSNQLYELNFGAFLHDVGKIKVPESVLKKPGKLSPEEWTVMKNHTVFGRDILLESELPFLRMGARICEQHHERYRGQGYPKGLSGAEITIGAAIVAVVDSYDAMTTDRVYQKARSKDEALSEIFTCRETLYHPDVVDAFLSFAENLD